MTPLGTRILHILEPVYSPTHLAFSTLVILTLAQRVLLHSTILAVLAVPLPQRERDGTISVFINAGPTYHLAPCVP